MASPDHSCSYLLHLQGAAVVGLAGSEVDRGKPPSHASGIGLVHDDATSIKGQSTDALPLHAARPEEGASPQIPETDCAVLPT